MKAKSKTENIMKDESDIIRDMISRKKGVAKGKASKDTSRSSKKSAAPSLSSHKHCIICHKAIPFIPEEHYCSPDCKGTHTLKIKKQKRMLYIMYGAMALVFGLIVYRSMIGT